MGEIAIQVESVGKRYRLGENDWNPESLVGQVGRQIGKGIKWLVGRERTHRREVDPTFWALRDVSFTVRAGEVVGIVGRNGAGKSTLLKVISRVTPPTTGRVLIEGRVGSLLEVGTGFHPDLTGRENVYLNGAILGMSRREVAANFDSIVAFAEVERFIDTPVKRYSSGMYVRLAFAVAAHLEPEILLIDEVLAVGDVGFQRKCLDRMQSAAREGRAILFVSHNLAAVETLCSRAILLAGGAVVGHGSPRAVIGQYLEETRKITEEDLGTRKDRSGSGRLRIQKVSFVGPDGGVTGMIRTGDRVEIVVEYATPGGDSLQDVDFSIHVYTANQEPVFNLWSGLVGQAFRVLPSSGRVRCLVEKWPIVAGRYSYNVFCQIGSEVGDHVVNAGYFDVGEGDFFGTGRSIPREMGDKFIVPQHWSASAEAPH
jgi:lipopolysaccharide transport system ATP-binding protein